MAKQFHDLEEMIRELQARDVRQVYLAGKVATTTSPGGKRITFRGRVMVWADLGAGYRAEYTRQVAPRIAEAEPPELAVTREKAPDLQRTQFALMCQLRAYRTEYRQVMDAARSTLTQRLKRAGIAVAEEEG